MTDTRPAEQELCERADCRRPGTTYHRFGKTVSTGPFTSGSGVRQPEHPIRLCPDHALSAFGFAFLGVSERTTP